MKVQYIVLAAIVVLKSYAANADPSPEIRWLMNTPMSLFDQGMLRLREEAKTSASSVVKSYGEYALANASYDYDRNSIMITAFILNPTSDKLIREGCQSIRSKIIKTLTFSFPNNVEYSLKSVSDFFDSTFSHPGDYQEKDRPKSVPEKLMQSTIFNLTYNIDDGGKSKIVSCEGKITTLNVPTKLE